MSLFPNEDVLTKLIMSWEGYSNTLPGEQRENFNKMLMQCYQYCQAINSRDEPLTDDALFMAIIFSQHRMIDILLRRIKELKRQINSGG